MFLAVSEGMNRYYNVNNLKYNKYVIGTDLGCKKRPLGRGTGERRTEEGARGMRTLQLGTESIVSLSISVSESSASHPRRRGIQGDHVISLTATALESGQLQLPGEHTSWIHEPIQSSNKYPLSPSGSDIHAEPRCHTAMEPVLGRRQGKNKFITNNTVP